MSLKISAAASLVLAFACHQAIAAVGFIYHDSATTTDGEFNSNFPIGNLKNSGHTSGSDQENANAFNESYATSQTGTTYPVTITLDFAEAVDLTKFYLWNHSNNGGAGAPANGVGDFTLTFYDGAGGGGSQIGAVFTDTASAAPATGLYSSEEFDFATYFGVRSVEFTILNKQGGSTSSWVAVRELGFEAIPEPGSLALLGLGLGSFLLRRRR